MTRASRQSAPSPTRWPDETSPLFGSPLVLADAGSRVARPSDAAILVGIGNPGEADENSFDILLTRTASAPRPWVSLPGQALEASIEQLKACAVANPGAASAYAQVLRIGEPLSFADALILESFAYSSLLGGAEFRAWRRDNPTRTRPPCTGAVEIERDGAYATIRIARAARCNALDCTMRDALCACLSVVRDDPGIAAVTLRGEGPDFCAGGDLDEFGTADDLATAHFIRTLRSPAQLAEVCGARLTARVQGACIGAGVEIAAACARVTAHPEAVFRLPEISMGLIPGAGGTASIPRRIGRHRTCYLGIAGVTIDAATALNWGLIEHVDAHA